MSVIALAEIRKSNDRYGNVEVFFICEDGETTGAIPFYSDEIFIDPGRVIGMTPAEARAYKCRVDADYLRS
jgi:hypothetical protein